MPSIKIKIDETELMDAINEKLDEVVDDVFANSQQIIVNKGIVDEGTLLKSGSIQREYLEKTIIYSALQADVIEFGRLPGTMPPHDPIMRWVLRKKIAKTEKEASKIAWAIMHDIKKNGLDPRPYLSPAIEIKKNELRSK